MSPSYAPRLGLLLSPILQYTSLNPYRTPRSHLHSPVLQVSPNQASFVPYSPSSRPQRHSRITMSPPAEIQADTLKRFIAGWGGWTMESFFATLSDDFTQKPLPLSCGEPARGREQLYPLLSSLMTMMTNFKVRCHECAIQERKETNKETT